MAGTVFIFGDSIGVPMTLSAIPQNVEPIVVVASKHVLPSLPGGQQLLHFPSKKCRSFVQEVRSHKPTLAIINSFSRILWPELIEAFPMGVVNVHLSKLPEYRGANTLQWTILNGEETTAATLHIVDEGIDSGPIIDERFVHISKEDTAVSLQKKLIAVASEMLQLQVPKLLTKKAQGAQQDQSKAQYWPRRSPADGVIDWTATDLQIHNLSRALVAPWPGVRYTDATGHQIVVDRVLSLEEIRKLREALDQ